mgnify:CR=1 FL=1
MRTEVATPRRERAGPVLTLRPISFRQANAFIAKHHRHHKPVQGQKFSISAVEQDQVVGVAVVGRPVARGYNPDEVAEVTRLCTDGTPNACSFLYAAAARACKAMGYRRIQTYLLASEFGTSARAAGFRLDGETKGGQWDHTSERQLRLDGGTRRADQPTEPKTRWVRDLC